MKQSVLSNYYCLSLAFLMLMMCIVTLHSRHRATFWYLSLAKTRLSTKDCYCFWMVSTLGGWHRTQLLDCVTRKWTMVEKFCSPDFHLHWKRLPCVPNCATFVFCVSFLVWRALPGLLPCTLCLSIAWRDYWFSRTIITQDAYLEGGLSSHVVPTVTLSGMMPLAYEDSYYG